MNQILRICFRLPVLFLFFFSLGCKPNQTEKNSGNSKESSWDTIRSLYAGGFSILQNEEGYQLSVKDPWQGATGIEYQYKLVKNDSLLHKQDDIPSFKIPVKRVICMSTTHVGMLEAIDETVTIKGVSGKKYIYNPELRSRANRGEIKDVGYDMGINYELMLSLKPDVIFIYGVAGENGPVINKMHALGLKPVFIAEYLEDSPLGRAEWLKFMSCFYDKLDTATRSFENISSTYQNLAEITRVISSSPVVITGLPWNDTWYASGGLSFISILIKDAGATYYWRDRKTRDAFPVDPETVIKNSNEIDFWINPGSAESLNYILQVDERLKNVKAFSGKRVFNNNAKLSKNGGNDYWESGAVNPHLALKDLIQIFHPGLLGEPELYYYKKLQ
ncbi:MAG: ABC transporter substrate-binding protein [Bacteroidota bacterium]